MKNIKRITSLVTSLLKFGATAGMSLALFGIGPAAHADYAFSGSGSSGTLIGASETWSFNADGATLEADWGSPGVGLGVVPYGESSPAFGMTLNFTGGGTIDAASVAIGNGASCAGNTNGGSTFCTIGPMDIWVATVTSPTSIKFTAQNPTYYLSQGQDYFVNVFFKGSTPTGFTGSWLTTYSPGGVPEPTSWALMMLGVGGIGLVMRRRVRNAALTAI